jgi:hypothetical protein
MIFQHQVDDLSMMFNEDGWFSIRESGLISLGIFIFCVMLNLSSDENGRGFTEQY